jgi:hypothetical protein
MIKTNAHTATGRLPQCQLHIQGIRKKKTSTLLFRATQTWFETGLTGIQLHSLCLRSTTSPPTCHPRTDIC